MADPTIPTRAEISRMVGGDTRMIAAFEELFLLIPDEINSVVAELEQAQFAWIGPALSLLNGRVSEISKRLDQEIRFESSDYGLLLNDSGVVLDTDSGDLVATMPDASLWKNEDKFVQNAGANDASIKLFGTQTVSGVDVVLIPSNTPHVTAMLKSDGTNLILLSDRNGFELLGAFYWEDETGDFIIDETGDEIVFV